MLLVSSLIPHLQETILKQLPSHLRADDWKSVLARPRSKRPPRVPYGITFYYDTFIEWAAEKGLNLQSNDDDTYAKTMVQVLATRKSLEKLVRGNHDVRDVQIDSPIDGSYDLMIMFCSNLTHLKDRLPQEEERAAIQLLQDELGLPSH